MLDWSQFSHLAPRTFPRPEEGETVEELLIRAIEWDALLLVQTIYPYCTSAKTRYAYQGATREESLQQAMWRAARRGAEDTMVWLENQCGAVVDNQTIFQLCQSGALEVAENWLCSHPEHCLSPDQTYWLFQDCRKAFNYLGSRGLLPCLIIRDGRGYLPGPIEMLERRGASMDRSGYYCLGGL